DLGVWPLHKQTARKLWEIMAAQTQGFVVLVIALPASDYSTTGRGHYLGYGVAVCPAEADEVGAFGNGFPEACRVRTDCSFTDPSALHLPDRRVVMTLPSSVHCHQVHWITKDIKVPYSAASRLVNGLNNNYRIELTRDGFEIDIENGTKLLQILSPRFEARDARR
ncbi:hypothetical protein FOZ62_016318, partial [Perkinsus olseni]